MRSLLLGVFISGREAVTETLIPAPVLDVDAQHLALVLFGRCGRGNGDQHDRSSYGARAVQAAHRVRPELRSVHAPLTARRDRRRYHAEAAWRLDGRHPRG